MCPAKTSPTESLNTEVAMEQSLASETYAESSKKKTTKKTFCFPDIGIALTPFYFFFLPGSLSDGTSQCSRHLGTTTTTATCQEVQAGRQEMEPLMTLREPCTCSLQNSQCVGKITTYSFRLSWLGFLTSAAE